jgi:hypothetical protein
MREWFVNFLTAFVSEKKNIKFMLKIVPKVAPKFCSGIPSLTFVDFLQCTFMAGFRNSFQSHRRLSEQLLESQAAIRKPEQAL